LNDFINGNLKNSNIFENEERSSLIDKSGAFIEKIWKNLYNNTSLIRFIFILSNKVLNIIINKTEWILVQRKFYIPINFYHAKYEKKYFKRWKNAFFIKK